MILIDIDLFSQNRVIQISQVNSIFRESESNEAQYLNLLTNCCESIDETKSDVFLAMDRLFSSRPIRLILRRSLVVFIGRKYGLSRLWKVIVEKSG